VSRNKLDYFKLYLRRLIYHVKNDLFSSENALLTIAVIICLILTSNSIVAMSRNWQLSERLASEKKQLELLRVEIDTLELENAYYDTDEFKELSARRLAGKQLPGEKLVYLGANSDQAKYKHTPAVVKVTTKEKSNFEKWLAFLFPKNS